MIRLLLICIPPLLAAGLALQAYLQATNILRSSHDVLRDLGGTEEKEEEVTFQELTETSLIAQIGGRFLPFLIGAGVCSFHALTAEQTSPMPLVLGGIALSLTYLVQKRREAMGEERKKQDLEFFLPVVMERIVMGVQAGLDIIPTLEAVHSLGLDEAEASHEDVDPVTKLVGHVIELNRSGQGLEEALAQTGKNAQATSVRHAFIHLSLAHREGGELMTPLRELSDATQLYYQETVEEVIATLPVKATMPLLCTFAGLIICFLTIPIIQVMSLTSKAVPGTGFLP